MRVGAPPTDRSSTGETAEPEVSCWTRWSAYAFMLTMPWAGVFARTMNPHDVARLAQTVVMVIAALAWMQLDTPWLPRKPGARRAVQGVMLLASGSIAFAPHLGPAGLEATAWMLLAMLAFVFARSPMATLLRELPPVIALAAALSVCLELPGMAFQLSNGRVPLARDFGFMYMNHRFLNHLQTLLLPLTLLPLLLPVARWARVAAWFGLVGGLVLLWRTGGRGTLIALGLVAFALPLLLREQRSRILRVELLAALATALGYGALFHAMPLLAGLVAEDGGSALQRVVGVNDFARVYLWERALADVRAHPWLGLGPMHYALSGNPYAAHPHNSALQVAAEWGVAMLLALSALLGAIAVTRWRDVRQLSAARTDPSSATMVAVALCAATAGVVDSLVSGTLVMPVSQTWWLVAMGLAMNGKGAAPDINGGDLVARRAVAVTLIVLHLGLAAAALVVANKPFTEEAVGMFPRYWGNGQLLAPPTGR